MCRPTANAAVIFSRRIFVLGKNADPRRWATERTCGSQPEILGSPSTNSDRLGRPDGVETVTYARATPALDQLSFQNENELGQLVLMRGEVRARFEAHHLHLPFAGDRNVLDEDTLGERGWPPRQVGCIDGHSRFGLQLGHKNSLRVSKSRHHTAVSSITCIRASSPKGMAQPPWVNPFLGSSSGPPGPWMTPSTVTWVISMIFPMISLRF